MSPTARESDPPAGPHSDTPFDAVCAAFEHGWRSGERPAIEDYLQGTAPSDRTSLLSLLIRIEVRERLRRGEHPRPEEYETRFPQDRDTILGLNWTTLATPEELAAATANFSTLLLPGVPQRIRVGRFELLHRLGVGGFGEVWRAFDTHLQREVALKIGHFGDSDKSRAPRLLHEAKSAGRLRHPGIVPVHDAGMDGERAYIVSELINGTTLSERLKTGPFPMRDAADLVRKIAEAVAHAHDHGVVHRDIKPANILLDQKGEPRLTDFGIARRASGDQTISHIGQVLGSPAYMSPEQARGDVAAVDHRSDVYSLGIVLYEMLSGRRAFPGDGRDALKRVLAGPPEPLRKYRKDVPRDLETIVETAMARERSGRYQTAADLANDLRRFLADEPILARRPSIAEQSWRFLRRHPLYFAVPLLVVLTFTFRNEIFGSNKNQNPSLVTVQPEPRDAKASLDSPLWFPGDKSRSVEIKTEPAGAKVWMFPIDRRNGWPLTDAKARIDAPGFSPTRVELPPGEYLVVGELPDGRFNEVHRWIPRAGEVMSVNAPPVNWKPLPDGSIRIRIDIPDLRADLIQVEQRKAYQPLSGSALPAVDIPAFLVSDRIALAKDCRDLNHDPPFGVDRDLPDSEPLTLTFDRAAGVLELLGLRLPDEFELELVAREALGEGGVESGLPVDFRKRPAEWTSSWAAPPPGLPLPSMATFGLPDPNVRVVRGADTIIEGQKSVLSLPFVASQRCELNRLNQNPNVAVRGVRSLRPRRNPEDFVRPVLSQSE